MFCFQVQWWWVWRERALLVRFCTVQVYPGTFCTYSSANTYEGNLSILSTDFANHKSNIKKNARFKKCVKSQFCVSGSYSIRLYLSLMRITDWRYTDKKENQMFLIYKEIQSEAVAKSLMWKGFLIYEEMRKYFPIYEEAVVHICITASGS